MSDLKISSDLFLEQAELRRLVRFLKTDGYQFLLLQDSASFGIIQNRFLDPEFLNFRIQSGTNPGTLQIKRDSYAITKDGNVAYQPVVDGLQIPTANQWYWIKLAYKRKPEEIGKVSVDRLGNLTGVGTKFTEVLRGQPNFPSRIAFTGNTLNRQSYEVRQVISDTSAVIVGKAFQAETDLQYKVVGTFTPGYVPTAEEKDIFQYSGAQLSFIAEGSSNAIPDHEAGREFILARVRINGSIIEIEDKRSDFWKTRAEHEANSLESMPLYPFGIEAIKWNNRYTTSDKNILVFSWTFRSTNWTFDSSLNRVSIAGGEGGRFLSTADFYTGNFNGWYLYLPSGARHRITNSVRVGSQINLTLDVIDVFGFHQGEEIIIAPDVDSVEIKAASDPDVVSTTQLDRTFVFPANTRLAEIELVVPDPTAYYYHIAFRTQTNQQYSKWQIPFENQVGYYTESSFDANGVLDTNELNRKRQPYKAHESRGYVRVVPSPNAFRAFADKIDTGDKFGVFQRQLDNAKPVVTLTVGKDSQHQLIVSPGTSGATTLTTNHVINLATAGARNGNTFYLDFVARLEAGGNTITINQGYQTTGDVGIVLKQLTVTDIDYMKIPQCKLSIKCVFDGSNWHITVVEKDKAILGTIQPFGAIDLQDFDVDGKGITQEYLGWHLCNGIGGTPDMSGKFLVAYDPNKAEYAAPGISGGRDYVTLALDQIPNHAHTIDVRDGNNNGHIGSANGSQRSGGNTGNIQNYPSGGQQPIDIRPAYFVMAFLQRVPYVA